MFVAAALLAYSAPGQAISAVAAATPPVQLKVGDLDSSRFRPYRSFWRVVEIAADGTASEAHRSLDLFELVMVGGRRAWRQTQHDLAPGQPAGSLHALTDFRTFAPIEALTRGPEGAYRHLRYAAEKVQLECRANLCPPDARTGEVVRREIPTAEPTFDYWGGSFGLLFAGLPLEVGKSFLVPVFHPVRGLIQLRVDVEAFEAIKAANGETIDAYRLRTPLTGWTYHISELPPYWVRLEYARPDGSRQITERLDASARKVEG